ncbi:nucleobase:cation symporter-2 family protein [Citrobacter rodentium]|jgi:uracil-xanthine permease/xanthine permease|uniref:Permease n=2 Tax=Citrobacter rodentium TaxID=67825 RepID=D2TP35_CITRI|nr:nucleobase:cation symporter-2 family protein [Citrobacter rodentium]KIQ49249.1 permease [Citrobacter rodentium]QBY29772.1 purine permease [Citrobacter rodentium]UHO32837.1 purine permease [Citrobacter rodentium NBRC 105723 = DSM 16636]CBG90106.1 putative permease [Citrobacter rodentium ICC168]HAT8013672.1 purine permease [Citrobacter rodentium NBRC 105723 = DSM 16636]
MKDNAEPASRNSAFTAPVDEVLPITQMFLYGLQHVLVMYAGAVAVPLVVGNAVGLPPEHIILLISADLVICGAATMLQSLGCTQWLGCRLPLIQGCTFAALIPMVLIGREYGIGGISGAVIVSGIFILCCAPWISKLIRFFPKVVMGSIVTLIGMSIMPVAGGWIGGGSSEMDNFGAPFALLMAAITLVIILNIYTFASGVLKNTSVLIGLIIGTVLWSFFQPLDFHLVNATQWLHLPTLMPFAKPEFHIIPVALLSMVMVVVMVETMSSMLATGDIVGKKVDAKMLRNGLNVCGLATLFCGFFNLFPYAAFAQNVGLIGLTGVRSRFVVSVSGIILMTMGLFAKMAALVVLIPKPILGGAGIVMFGMVAVSGIRTLGQVNYRNNNNGMVVALTLGLGMMPVLVPNLFTQFNAMLQLFLHSGITIGTLTAIVANLTLNGSAPFRINHDAPVPDPAPPSSAARNMAVRTVRMWLLLRKVQKDQLHEETQES